MEQSIPITIALGIQKNHRTFQEIPLHSPKVTVWYEFTATFIIGPFFFENNTRNGPVTGTVTSRRYRKSLKILLYTEFNSPNVWIQLPLCRMEHFHKLDSIQQFLRQHFTNDKVTSRAFPTIWPPRSPDHNPVSLGLGILKKFCLSKKCGYMEI